MRILRRRYGHPVTSGRSVNATYLINLGFDRKRCKKYQSEQKTKNKTESIYPVPGKLNGFLLTRNSINGGGFYAIAYDEMEALGSTKAMIEEAMALQLKAPDNLLPHVLHFVLPRDAVREEDQWDHDGTFTEEYEDYTKEGLFCHGNGITASRMCPGGCGRFIIDCVPAGANDADPKDYCEYSVRKECKPKSRLSLNLFQIVNGKPAPLVRELGYDALFLLETTAEFTAPRILGELDAAANRLDGRIARLTGSLSFTINARRTGGGSVSVAHTGQVQIALDQIEISRRENEARQWRLEDLRAERGEIKMIAANDPQTEIIESLPPSGQDSQAEETTGPAPELAPTQSPQPTTTTANEPGLSSQSTDEWSDEYRAEMLDAYIQRLAADEEISVETAIRRVCDFEHNGKLMTCIVDVMWYLEGQDESKRKFRKALLRDLCQRLATEDQERFFSPQAGDENLPY